MGHGETLADDLLRGLRAIAQFTGDSKSGTAALCEAGQLPVGKERGLWIASRRRLRQHYEHLTAGDHSGERRPTVACFATMPEGPST